MRGGSRERERTHAGASFDARGRESLPRDGERVEGDDFRDVRIDASKVRDGRDAHLARELRHRRDERRDPRRGLAVPRDGFDRGEDEWGGSIVAATASLAHRVSRGVDLDGIAERGARAVQL